AAHAGRWHRRGSVPVHRPELGSGYRAPVPAQSLLRTSHRALSLARSPSANARRPAIRESLQLLRRGSDQQDRSDRPPAVGPTTASSAASVFILRPQLAIVKHTQFPFTVL